MEQTSAWKPIANHKESGYPQKHSFFHDTTSERMERQEKLYKDIFSHKIDKHTLNSILPIDLEKIVPKFKNKRSLDDQYIDSEVIQTFQIFDRLAEGVMRIVFNEAVENGFFGMLTEQNCSTYLTKQP